MQGDCHASLVHVAMISVPSKKELAHDTKQPKIGIIEQETADRVTSAPGKRTMEAATKLSTEVVPGSETLAEPPFFGFLS